MAETPQSYANHARLVPMFHYFALPILLINECERNLVGN